MKLNNEERKAVATLQRLSKKWPKSLWLFSGSGSLCVMKKNDKGERALSDTDGMCPEHVVAKIDIENDGGDW